MWRNRPGSTRVPRRGVPSDATSLPALTCIDLPSEGIDFPHVEIPGPVAYV